MFSCGLYGKIRLTIDFSGEWAFQLGLPAKSGVSGCLYAVIPNFGSICVYSPPLDEIGNSVRGIEFFMRFVNRFTGVHLFEKADSNRPTVFQSQDANSREKRVSAFYAAGILALMFRRRRPL